jgi:hypothetical protein
VKDGSDAGVGLTVCRPLSMQSSRRSAPSFFVFRLWILVPLAAVNFSYLDRPASASTMSVIEGGLTIANAKHSPSRDLRDQICRA